MVLEDHIGLCNIMFTSVGSLLGLSLVSKDLTQLGCAGSAEKMALGRVKHSGSEALPDAARVPLSP